jgi:hypothetical protein
MNGFMQSHHSGDNNLISFTVIYFVQFSAADRTSLLHTSFVLAEAGKISYSISMEMSKSLKLESHPTPFSIGSAQLFKLRKYLNNTTVYELYLVRSIDVLDRHVK